MNTYMFITVTTMKAYNNKKWWIDGDIIRTKYIEANTVNEALKKFQEIVENDNYISISNNALKNKAPMYIDTKAGDCKQVGYVITGKTDFQTDSGKWSSQYVDLWVNIETIIDTDF